MKILRKILVLFSFIFPVFVSTDCKKQAKCGCNGDVVDVVTKEQARVYFNETGTSIWFNPVNNPYSTYYFCNPGEMFPKLADANNGDILLVSGNAYWECNFLYSASNYSYYSSMVKVFQIQVTDVYADLYGKKK